MKREKKERKDEKKLKEKDTDNITKMINLYNRSYIILCWFLSLFSLVFYFSISKETQTQSRKGNFLLCEKVSFFSFSSIGRKLLIVWQQGTLSVDSVD